MGRGKANNPTGRIARVSTGQVLFEMDGRNWAEETRPKRVAPYVILNLNKQARWDSFRFRLPDRPSSRISDR
ncbi:hypothetical protein PIB30_074036 [Stylosanthes scabra]|uniref:Ribosomal protein L27 n=1 Tax=Stylosanthes scabra TaxID=79078 RepID=A0ABU6SQT5_9FABA|nr:hypothetical protein [Stylosanthes scabra]